MNLSLIAKVILHFFNFEESESEIYWLFSGFAKQWEAKLSNLDKMVRHCSTVGILYINYRISFIRERVFAVA